MIGVIIGCKRVCPGFANFDVLIGFEKIKIKKEKDDDKKQNDEGEDNNELFSGSFPFRRFIIHLPLIENISRQMGT
ncbi:hypothetical protein GCM10023115_40070 [Pontixanthobacter gangjinensis]